MQAEQLKYLGEGLHFSPQKLPRIVVNTASGYTTLDIDDIIRLQSDNNYTRIYFSDGRQVMISKTLKEFEDALEGTCFIRVHRSDIINIMYLKDVLNDGALVLKDGTTITTSRRKHREFLRHLKNFFYHL